MRSEGSDRVGLAEAYPGDADGPASTKGPRRGLVLGAGGVLGAAWMAGALRTLELETGVDPRYAETVVGTSAGSVLAASIASGIGTEELARHQVEAGEPPAPDVPPDFHPDTVGGPRIEYDYDSQGALPPRPQLGRIGSSRLLLAAARRPRSFPPLAAVVALLPPGRRSGEEIAQLVDRVAPDDGNWPAAPRPWIVTMDYDSGRRVAFGRPGSPEASLRSAVQASCAIPGWYEPVQIGGHRYVDGGTCSATSLDLLAGRGLDEVYVLAPMASFALDHPSSAFARLERGVRRAATARLRREAARVRRSGTRVVMLGPGPRDLEAIGANLMDPSRRRRVFDMAMETTGEALAEAMRLGHVGTAA